MANRTYNGLLSLLFMVWYNCWLLVYGGGLEFQCIRFVLLWLVGGWFLVLMGWMMRCSWCEWWYVVWVGAWALYCGGCLGSRACWVRWYWARGCHCDVVSTLVWPCIRYVWCCMVTWLEVLRWMCIYYINWNEQGWRWAFNVWCWINVVTTFIGMVGMGYSSLVVVILG